MSENQNYSELKWKFADFINCLDVFLVKDTKGVDFMHEVVAHSLKNGVKNPLE